MKPCEIETIIIEEECLAPGGIYFVKKVLKPFNEVLIMGTILNPDKMPSKGACVEVRRVGREEALGCVFTNSKGKFGFTVRYDPEVDYELSVYSPL